ncbi:hypothetical protein EDB89DRAFT_2162504 [Lactarius sanguifluus]|nr:hypothetical protein EDB89DRAFT_2162504 [Lactarius sanguifluus]
MVRMLDVARTAEAIKLRNLVVKKLKLTEPTYPYRGAQAQVARQQRQSYIYLLHHTTTPLFIQRDVLRRSSHKSIEFLHHGLEQGSPFPPFSEYQDTFSNKLTPNMFAAFAVPLWIPQPQQLLCFAKATYPYWKERRIEQGGHHIIPTLNYVESDIKNESYICFRRCDVKAMRKTRASQASSSEKLMLLKQELATAAELTSVLKREQLMRERGSKQKRLKRKFPSLLNAKEDEELFYDKEKVVKKPKLTEPTRIVGLRLKSQDNNGNLISPTQHHDAVVRPKERATAILAQVDREMARIKDRDHHWEDRIENAYQPQPVAHAQWHFNGSPHLSQLDRHHYCCRHLRPLLLMTNCPLQNGVPSKYAEVVESSSSSSRESSPSFATTGSEVNEEQRATDREVSWPIHDRWLFDADNEPSVRNDGPDEKDRALLNEFHPTYLLKGMSLKKTIIQQLTTDPTIYTPSSDGRLLGFCLIGPASPPRFVATPSLLFHVPLSLRPPSWAAAMHQHQHQQQSAQQGAIGTPQTTGHPFLCSSK